MSPFLGIKCDKCRGLNIVEENGSLATPTHFLSSVGQSGTATASASAASKRGPQLAKVHKHLESVDFEDQDKIYVVEVS